MVGVEPLYCRVCGAEECSCGHTFSDDGPYCEINGVIHTADDLCPFEVREEDE